MHSFSSLLSTIACICINIRLTTPQSTSSTTSTPTNSEETLLYVIIGILSTIIVLMICAAILYLHCKHKKAKNKISFGIKTIAANIDIDHPTDKVSESHNQIKSATPTPKTTTSNITKPALNIKKVSFDIIDKPKHIPNRQILSAQHSFPNYAPNLQQNNLSHSHSNNQLSQNTDKTAQSSAASKNFIQFLNSSVSQRNLTANPASTTAANNAAASNTVQQNIYLQEQRAAFARTRIASSPNLNIQPNNNRMQNVAAPPTMNRAMFSSQRNVNFATPQQPQQRNINAQHIMMQARRAQSVRNLTGNTAQPQTINAQQAQQQNMNMNINAQHRMMQARRAQSVRNLTGNTAQNNYQQQFPGAYTHFGAQIAQNAANSYQQQHGYGRNRAMTDPQSNGDNCEQNAVQNVQGNADVGNVGVEEDDLEESSSGSSSIRTGTESDDAVDSDDVDD